MSDFRTVNLFFQDRRSLVNVPVEVAVIAVWARPILSRQVCRRVLLQGAAILVHESQALCCSLRQSAAIKRCTSCVNTRKLLHSHHTLRHTLRHSRLINVVLRHDRLIHVVLRHSRPIHVALRHTHSFEVRAIDGQHGTLATSMRCNKKCPTRSKGYRPGLSVDHKLVHHELPSHGWVSLIVIPSRTAQSPLGDGPAQQDMWTEHAGHVIHCEQAAYRCRPTYVRKVGLKYVGLQSVRLGSALQTLCTCTLCPGDGVVRGIVVVSIGVVRRIVVWRIAPLSL